MREADPPAVWVVADDYGISPGVGAATRELIAGGYLSGTGCMTLFPEWPEEAALLRSCSGIEKAVIGIHLTLTDFRPITGKSALAPQGVMPPLKTLIRQCLTGPARIEAAVHAELDAQLDAFIAAMGHAPDYIDGHQHVHFLRPVRSWLKSRHSSLAAYGPIWLRGAPSLRLASGARTRAKVMVVALLAAGFDRSMRKAGHTVAGPLAGFYDWTRPSGFAEAIGHLRALAPEGAVIMCHPGEIDPLLKQRDTLTAARPMELAMFRKAPFQPLFR